MERIVEQLVARSDAEISDGTPGTRERSER
jgi:hypothetical protein